jgi:hypothetical protein
MKKSNVFFLFPLVVLLSMACGSAPQTETPPPGLAAPPPPETPPPPPETASVPEPAPEEDFDPHSISKEIFDSTKTEVQHFIEELNGLIRGKNYSAWKATLAPDFFTEISSSGYLQRASESAALKSRNIVLKSPEDYFTHVVVPSRANSRVDDIEFVSQNRVKAFTINPNGQRLRLYDLEHTGNTWLIIN